MAVVRSALAGPHRWLHVALSALMILSAVVVVLTVLLMRTDAIRVSRVLTGSMKPLLPVGTVVVTRPVPSSQVEVGDVIMFMPPKEWAGPKAKPVIHRIVEITHTDNGATGIRTKGDNNTAVDPWTLNMTGAPAYKLIWNSYWLGRLFDFVRALWLPVLITLIGVWGLSRIVRWLWFPSGRRFPDKGEAEDDQPPHVGPAPPRPPVHAWPAMTITALFSSNGDRPYVESASPRGVSDDHLAAATETVPMEAVEAARVKTPAAGPVPGATPGALPLALPALAGVVAATEPSTEELEAGAEPAAGPNRQPSPPTPRHPPP